MWSKPWKHRAAARLAPVFASLALAACTTQDDEENEENFVVVHNQMDGCTLTVTSRQRPPTMACTSCGNGPHGK